MADKDVKIVLTATDRTKAAFSSAQQGMTRLNSAATGMGRALGMALPALGVAGFAAFAKSSIDAADGMNDLSQKLGVGVKDLASFKLAAEQSGTSLEGVGNGIARLSRSIGEAEGGNKKLAKALQDLGITARDPKEAFLQLADATEKIADPAKRAALLSQVLGKSYQDLVPLLAQGGDELRKSAIASESFADAMARLAPDADRFNDQLALLKINAAGISASILTDIVPPMGDWLVAVNKLIDRHGVWLGILSAIGAAAIPGVTAGDIAGDVSLTAFKRELDSARDELANIEAATKSGTFGLIQMALYGSEEDMRRKGDYLRSNIKTLEESIQQFEKRTAAKPKFPAGADNVIKFPTPRSSAKATDPLAGILSQTDTARAAEYEKLLGLLETRFQSGRKNAQQFGEAVAILNKQFGKDAIDPLGSGSFSTTSKATADMIRAQQDAINGLNSEMAQEGVQAAEAYESALESLLSDTTVAKTADLYENIDLLNRAFFDGTIGVEQYDQAIQKLTEGTDAKLEKTKSIAEDLGMTFASAFEDAIVGGEGLSDVLKGLEQDIMRIVTRKMVTEPLADFVTSSLGSFLGGGSSGGGMPSLPGSDQNILGSFASLFGFADGGVAAYGRPVDLPRFAGGGVSNSAAIFAEAGPEAAVPLPDGRNIPVKFKNGSGGGTNEFHFHGVTDFDSFKRSKGQMTAMAVAALQRGRRNL